MLNIGVKVNVDIKDVKYPVYFEGKNICAHCGAEGSLVLVDKFGNETRREIHPFDHIKCRACGRVFSIKWVKDPTNNKLIPCAVSPCIKQEFVNFINLNKNKTQNIGDI